MRVFSRLAQTILAFGLLMATATPALAESLAYKADLNGASEVPPNDSKGTGTVAARYDTATKKLTWTVTYQGLTGPATAAHFHGPAAPGVNAGPQITLEGNLASPVKGETTLTDAQAAELAKGIWYLNVHTAAHPPGEIRGQLVKK
jgi:CHRD domain